MADWYVDGAVVGGNGTSPVSAFPSVYSITWADRDRAWVRNTHVEALVASKDFGPGSSWQNIDAFDRYVSVIGWPQLDETLYDERPAAGVSAGWDSDQPSTKAYSSYGYKFPTFTSSIGQSDSSPPRIGRVYLTNFFLVNCGAGGFFSFNPWQTEILGDGARFGTIVPLFNHGPQVNLDGNNRTFDGPIIERLICVGSNASQSTQFFDGNGMTRCMEIHSSSIIRELFSTQNIHFHGHVINYSNSLAYIVSANGTANGFGFEQRVIESYVRRVSGIKPYSGAYERVTGAQYEGRFTIEDYYGEGPRTSRYFSHGMQTGTSSDAFFNGAPAVWMYCNSIAGQIRGKSNYPRVDPAVSELFPVTSGTLIEIRVPLWADNTGVCSFGDGNMVGVLLAKGAKNRVATRSMVLVGSPTLWTGSLTTTGSAYFMSCKFTPQETGNVMFEFYAAQAPVQATSGAALGFYWLVGKPFKV